MQLNLFGSFPILDANQTEAKPEPTKEFIKKCSSCGILHSENYFLKEGEICLSCMDKTDDK